MEEERTFTPEELFRLLDWFYVCSSDPERDDPLKAKIYALLGDRRQEYWP